MNSPSLSKAWYRQFWPWFLFSLPASVVVAGFITLYIALSNNDYRVDDNYSKDGLRLKREDASDRLADKLGLRARLFLLAGNLNGSRRLEIVLHGQAAPSSIMIRLNHPTDARIDVVLLADKVDESQKESSESMADFWSHRYAVSFDNALWHRIRGRREVSILNPEKNWHLQGRCQLNDKLLLGDYSCDLEPKVFTRQ